MSSDTLKIGPGQSVRVRYLSALIPTEVFVSNESILPGNFIIRGASVEEGVWINQWGYYSPVQPHAEVSVRVNWPSGLAEIFNNSMGEAILTVRGNGIFPFHEDQLTEELLMED